LAAAPGEPGGDERPQVIEHLEHRQQVPVDAHPVVVEPRGLLGMTMQRNLTGDADGNGWIVVDEAHPFEQRIVVVDRVAVDAADVSIPRQIDPAVQRIGLAAILLVDDEQPGIGPAAIDLPDVHARQRPSVERVGRFEP